jgi:hypothetical protein
MPVTLTYLGTHWAWSGDLFTIAHPNGNEARVYVDSIGETWVDIRRVPDGGYFHTERVEAYRAYNGAEDAERHLRERGFVGVKRPAPYAHRVRERSL